MLDVCSWWMVTRVRAEVGDLEFESHIPLIFFTWYSVKIKIFSPNLLITVAISGTKGGFQPVLKIVSSLVVWVRGFLPEILTSRK